jgi:hypothetical protein
LGFPFAGKEKGSRRPSFSLKAGLSWPGSLAPWILPPSCHPQRQEAIVIVGRNAPASRYSLLVQPFGRDDEGKPVWRRLAVARYDVPMDEGYQPGGLLDYLFAANRKEVKSYAPGETLNS